jgi:hypothetical protein
LNGIEVLVSTRLQSRHWKAFEFSYYGVIVFLSCSLGYGGLVIDEALERLKVDLVICRAQVTFRQLGSSKPKASVSMKTKLNSKLFENLHPINLRVYEVL